MIVKSRGLKLANTQREKFGLTYSEVNGNFPGFVTVPFEAITRDNLGTTVNQIKA